MIRKFALYYGVTRKGEKKVISFGNRCEINIYKEKCKKDIADPKMAEQYEALVLATDYGLKNTYKLAEPVKKETKKK